MRLVGQPGHDHGQILGEKLNVAALPFDQQVHVATGSLAIEIFEMCRDHGVVHRPLLLEKMAASRPPFYGDEVLKVFDV
jgi:hypothetical protein